MSTSVVASFAAALWRGAEVVLVARLMALTGLIVALGFAVTQTGTPT